MRKPAFLKIKPIRVRVWWPVVSVFLVMLSLRQPAYAGTLGNSDGLFIVEDAPAQFDALKHHPEALAWRNPESLGAPDPSVFDHYQGLVRNPNPGSPVFYVSQLDDDDDGTAGGYLHIVRFASRTKSGERLKSNLQQIGNDTEEAYPPVDDTWVRSLRFDGTPFFDGEPLPVYKHPGSMALVDDVLFVPVDQPTEANAPSGQLLLFDVSVDPTQPLPLQALALDHGIDNVAVTRLINGIYRIWTNGDGGNDINIYDTTVTNLRADTLDLRLVQAWDPATDLLGTIWPTGTGAHQSSTFLRDIDDTLYLIGMRHPGGLPFIGSDYADLYQVDESIPEMLTLTHLRTRKFNCVYDGGGGPVDMRVCNMTASNNAYVSPTGELILYSIPHDDEDGFDPDIVRMGEFRHRDVNREGSPLRFSSAEILDPYQVNEGSVVVLSGIGGPPIDRPWVELYDDSGFRDRSIVIDYDDRKLFELDEFDSLDDFTDKTSSVRWRSPVGLDIELYDDDDFSDRYIVLAGTGQTEGITNVGSQVIVAGLVEHFDPTKNEGETLAFNDKTSSMRWVGWPPDFGPPVLTWDLDGDSHFGETGRDALRGDELGTSPSFDATSLDGPVDVQISLRVSVPGSDEIGGDAAVIHVLNIPPAVTIDSLMGYLPNIGLIGMPITLEGNFLDAPGDTHTAEIDWGDGITTSANVDSSNSTVSSTHVYDTAGEFHVELALVDDDLGRSFAAAPITVIDSVDAIEEVLDQIDGLLETSLNSRDRTALKKARNRIDGNKGGRAKNGVLDKLDRNNPVAALVKLESTIKNLGKVGQIDVTSLELLLTLAANSVARTTLYDATNVIGPLPTPEQQDRLDEAIAWLVEGEAKVEELYFTAAVRSFRFATALALEALALL